MEKVYSFLENTDLVWIEIVLFWWLVVGSTEAGLTPYRGTSLIRNRAPPGPYSRTMPRALWWS